MDALIVGLLVVYLYFRNSKQIQLIEENISPEDGRKLEVKTNPTFNKDEGAFTELYNCIMKEGTVK